VNDGYRLTPRAQQGLERLAANPGIGHRREDLTLNKSVRFWSVGPTLIAYRSEHSPIEVLFIERGEVDWERLLIEHDE
jgi:plasmid stabilization system protein ParE